MVSRQRLWARKQMSLGLCRICGGPRLHYAQMCDKCAVKARVLSRKYMRQRLGISLYKKVQVTNKTPFVPE